MLLAVGPGMVEGVVGLMGKGKTYYTTARALEALKAGRRVVANYHIEGCEYAPDWDAVMNVREGLVVIDEANLWCPSRFWAKLDPRLLYYWSQSRKLGLDILWTAQHESRVDTALREITYQVWLSKRLGPLFMYAAYLPDEARKSKRLCLGRRWLLRKKAVTGAYDTFQLIDLAASILDKSDGPVYREASLEGPTVNVNLGSKRQLKKALK